MKIAEVIVIWACVAGVVMWLAFLGLSWLVHGKPNHKAGSAAVVRERLKDVILSDRMNDRSRWRAIGKRALERIREAGHGRSKA